jgi:hypothetical protein
MRRFSSELDGAAFLIMSKKRTAKPAPYVSYSEKLRDPRWQKMRLKIMERDGFKCRHCRDKEKTLNVHHSHYTKGAAPWEYDESTLLTLCEDCHAMIEQRNKLMLIATFRSPRRHIQALNFLGALDGDGPWAEPEIVWMTEAVHSLLQAWDSLSSAKSSGGTTADAVEAMQFNAVEIIQHLGVILKKTSELDN